MTVSQEPYMDDAERQAGLEALVAKIEQLVAEWSRPVAAAVSEWAGFDAAVRAAAAGDAAGELGGIGVGEECGARPLTPHSAALRVGPLPGGERGFNGGASRIFSGRQDAGDPSGPLDAGGPSGGLDAGAPREWVCLGQASELVLRVCRTLRLAPRKLDELVRECRGISAVELVDGLRVGRVKPALAELLKKYARQLWLSPGMYAHCLVRDPDLKVWPTGLASGSKYFVDPAATWRRAEVYETREERRALLLKAFDDGWSRGDLSKDGFAARLGFRGFRQLSRACLNVFGQTPRELAYEILCEIVEFYLTAEVKTLRELACTDSESHTVLRARFLYRGNCERPVLPVGDAWENSDPAWREALAGLLWE